MIENNKNQNNQAKVDDKQSDAIRTIEQDLLDAVIGGIQQPGGGGVEGGSAGHCGRSTSSMLNMEFFIAIADESWDDEANQVEDVEEPAAEDKTN